MPTVKDCLHNCDDLHSYNTSDWKTARLGEEHGCERSSEWSGACVKTESETKTCEAHAGASRLKKPILKTKQTKKQKKNNRLFVV